MNEALREVLKRIAENDPSFDEDEYVWLVCPSLPLFLLTLTLTLSLSLSLSPSLPLSFPRLSAVLRDKDLDDNGAVALAEALKTNTHLKVLL